MKYTLLLMFTLTIMATIAKADMQNNGHNFPDGLPCSFLLAQNHGQDDKFSDTEIASITSLDLNDKLAVCFPLK